MEAHLPPLPPAELRGAAREPMLRDRRAAQKRLNDKQRPKRKRAADYNEKRVERRRNNETDRQAHAAREQKRRDDLKGAYVRGEEWAVERERVLGAQQQQRNAKHASKVQALTDARVQVLVAGEVDWLSAEVGARAHAIVAGEARTPAEEAVSRGCMRTAAARVQAREHQIRRVVESSSDDTDECVAAFAALVASPLPRLLANDGASEPPAPAPREQQQPTAATVHSCQGTTWCGEQCLVNTDRNGAEAEPLRNGSRFCAHHQPEGSFVPPAGSRQCAAMTRKRVHDKHHRPRRPALPLHLGESPLARCAAALRKRLLCAAPTCARRRRSLCRQNAMRPPLRGREQHAL